MPKAKSYDHEVRWPAMRILAEQGSIEKLCEMLQQGEDVYERLASHRFAIRFLSFRPWANRSLDVIAAIAVAGISTASEAAHENPDDAAWFREEASQLAYNTSLNLAVCWDDGFGRTETHFSQGLKLSKTAIDIRQSLKKGPSSMGLAWTTKGIHELSLGKVDDATSSFETAKKLLIEASKAKGAPTGVTPKASVDLILAHGYSALTALRKGAASGVKDLEVVCKALDQLKSGDPSDRESAELGIEQMRMMRSYLQV